MEWFVKEQIGICNGSGGPTRSSSRLWTQGLAEKDPAKREQIYLRMQEIMDDTGAYVFINHEPEVFAHKA